VLSDTNKSACRAVSSSLELTSASSLQTLVSCCSESVSRVRPMTVTARSRHQRPDASSRRHRDVATAVNSHGQLQQQCDTTTTTTTTTMTTTTTSSRSHRDTGTVSDSLTAVTNCHTAMSAVIYRHRQHQQPTGTTTTTSTSRPTTTTATSSTFSGSVRRNRHSDERRTRHSNVNSTSTATTTSSSCTTTASSSASVRSSSSSCSSGTVRPRHTDLINTSSR